MARRGRWGDRYLGVPQPGDPPQPLRDIVVGESIRFLLYAGMDAVLLTILGRSWIDIVVSAFTFGLVAAGLMGALRFRRMRRG